MKKLLPLLLFIIFAPSALAWDSVGHKVIAHIAYHHLSPKAKAAVDRLTSEEGQHHTPYSRFIFISTWMDWERTRGNKNFDTWHYINRPCAEPGIKTRPPAKQNVVDSIERCIVTLNTPRPVAEHRLGLKILVHLVGDVHQPLHNICHYTPQHPLGDHGGNDFPIHSKTASTLHAYWDMGLGEFRRFHTHSAGHETMLKQYADSIEAHYPSTTFVPTRINTKPREWSTEGYDIARMFVYPMIKENETPSRQYHYEGKQIMEQRLAIAAYRLAAVLNQIYG